VKGRRRRGNGLEVPTEVRKQVEAVWVKARATGNRMPPPTHQLCGEGFDRASVGLPGHCFYCAVVGHVVAHPEYGCGDVHCRVVHE
jgi:hypothetical protein